MPISFILRFELLRQTNHDKENAAKQQTPLQFVITGEDQRRDDSHEQSTERAPRGDHQIKCGEMARMRLEPKKIAGTNHATDEDAPAIDSHLLEKRTIRRFHKHPL